MEKRWKIEEKGENVKKNASGCGNEKSKNGKLLIRYFTGFKAV